MFFKKDYNILCINIISFKFMIEIKNLTKKFGNTVVLDNVNFEVKKGEILGFLGPNGAGKTTTMKIITSFWAPTSGKVIVDGIDVTENSLEARKKIGYLPETVPLYEDMRVYEYLKFVAEVRGIKKSEIKDSVRRVVKDCSLSNVLKKPIDELSKGYRQRVGLAQAIIHNPEILILDEPTTGLDPNQIIEIRDLIKKIGKEKTIILSTHILSEVGATCDRVVVINNGKIVGEGTPAELAQKVKSRDIIYLKIKGIRDEITKKLKEIEGVVRVDVKDKESENVYGYEIEPEVGVDLREKISALVIKSGWSILEFSTKTASLEDVFRELTK